MNRPLFRLAIISSHPIQYNAPFFRLLAQEPGFEVKVFYTWSQSANGAKYDPGFGKNVEWDIPLLEGYDYRFVDNTADDPGSHHFKGIINPGLINEIKQWEPHAVFIFGWSFHSHLQCMRYFHGKIPVLFRGDSTLLDEKPGIRKWIRRLFLRWVYSHIDYALYVGANNRNYFLKHGLRDDQLVFAPHAIDNNRFAEPGELYGQQAKTWRHELGIADDDLVVLFAGKLEPKKNPLFVLQLAGIVKEENVKFLFAGNGKLEHELKAKSIDDRRIHFLGFQNQQRMPVVYRLGDIFILPSKGPGETWGLSINEAMASGLAVMVSEKAGGAIDLVREKQNGIVFGTADIDSCTGFLKTVLQDRKGLEKMKKASAAIIKEYAIEKNVAVLIKLLRKTGAA